MIAGLIGGTVVGDPEAKVNNFAKIEEGKNYCDDCKAKFKQEKKTRTKTKVKVESDISGKEIVYELDGLCDINDLELNSIYKGRVTKIERFGIFISLNNQVWGLMRVRNSSYKVGDTIFARISEIKEKKHEVDMAPARIQSGEYVIKKVKKNIKRTSQSLRRSPADPADLRPYHFYC